MNPRVTQSKRKGKGTHIRKETGYLDRKRKVLALGTRLRGGGGSVTPENYLEYIATLEKSTEG